MSLINNDRDMQKLLNDLQVGEFSETDLKLIACRLPKHVLAAALYALVDPAPMVLAATHDQKADVIAQLLHAWICLPDLRLGQLIDNATRATPAALYFIEDAGLVQALEKERLRYISRTQ